MAEDKDQYPAPHSGGHQPQGTVSAAVSDGGDPPKKNRTKCLLYILLFTIFQAGIILTFILVIMKVRTPQFRLRFATANPTPEAAGNTSFTLAAELSVRNPNFGRYKYLNTTVAFFYRGTQIGAAEVAKSSVNWRSTKKIKVAADLDLGPATAESTAGVVRVTCKARMAGRVEVVFVMKKKRSADMACTVDIATTPAAGSPPEVRNVVCK